MIHEKHIGMVGYPKLGRILKPLVDRHGWDAVKPVWEYFCEFAPYADSLARIEAGVTRNGEKPIKKLGYSTSPQAFVEHYTHWAQEAAAA